MGRLVLGAVDPVVIEEPRLFEFSDSKRHLSKKQSNYCNLEDYTMNIETINFLSF